MKMLGVGIIILSADIINLITVVVDLISIPFALLSKVIFV